MLREQAHSYLGRNTNKEYLDKANSGLLEGGPPFGPFSRGKVELGEGDCKRNTDHKIKEGHDKIGEMDSIPGAVVNGRERGARVVNEDHEGNRETAKNVQRLQTLLDGYTRSHTRHFTSSHSGRLLQ